MQARVFNSLGYDTLLVDFRGVGGSSGNSNTIGIREAQDVVSSLNYARTLNSKRQRWRQDITSFLAEVNKN